MSKVNSSKSRSYKAAAFIFIVLLIIVVVYVAIRLLKTEKSDKEPFNNVILISLDTLGAGHMGIYGYNRDTSPYLDEMARESILFENAYAQSPNTLISHATMLTSLPPLVHGATPDFILDDTFATLAEYFKKKGYQTAGFTTHGSWLNETMGFAQGFDTFHSDFIDARQNNRLIFDFLEKNAGKKFFLFAHYYDIHSDFEQLPYETRSAYDRKFCGDYKGDFKGCRFNICGSSFLEKVNRDKWKVNIEELEFITALYDGGISYTDNHIRNLFNKLKELHLYEKSLIIVTSDHGEEFLQHGKVLHTQLYKEIMHVPLIIKLPHKKEHKRIKSLVGVIDIMPTILDIMGIKYKSLMGESVLPLILPEKEEKRFVYSFLPDINNAISVRNSDYSFHTKNSIHRYELYDLRKDPGERFDISASENAVKDELSKKIRENIKTQLKMKQRFKYKKKKAVLTEEEREKLKSLGYID